MPSPRRKPKLYVPANLTDAELDRLDYGEQIKLMMAGHLTAERVNASTYRKMLQRTGGVDPFAHLRDEWGQR